MNDQYRASEEDWQRAMTTAASSDGFFFMRCFLELRARVHALEQRPIAGDHELAPATEDSSVTAPPDAEEPQTLHSVALRMVDTLERLGVLLEIRQTLKRAIREPMAPATAAAAPVATDDELWQTWHDADGSTLESLRAIYNLGREHGASQASCPHIRSSGERANV
jgi:hypothetical protein